MTDTAGITNDMDDDEFFVDFGDVPEASGFEAIPRGRYDVIVDQVELKDSNSSEYKYLNWQLSVADGPFAKRKLWYVTSFHPESAPMMRRVLASAGVPAGVKFKVDRGSKLLLEPDVVGLAGVAKVGTRVYDGDVKNNVKDLVFTPRDGRPVASSATAAPDGAPARKFI